MSYRSSCRDVTTLVQSLYSLKDDKAAVLIVRAMNSSMSAIASPLKDNGGVLSVGRVT